MTERFEQQSILPPNQALTLVRQSGLSPAKTHLIEALITQSRSFEYHPPDGQQSFLVLDVTRFLNHRVNPHLIAEIGVELAQLIQSFQPDIVLTAPASGNIPTLAIAQSLDLVPDLIYAHKGVPITMKEGEIFRAPSRSYTDVKPVDLVVSQHCLHPNQKVVISDDFLDTGRTALDLSAIVRAAQSTVVAFAFVIEKPFSGRNNLRDAGFSDQEIISLIQIDDMQEGRLKIHGFDQWFELAIK